MKGNFDPPLGMLTVEIQSPTTPFLILKYIVTLIYFPELDDYFGNIGVWGSFFKVNRLEF
jgi:hypothetical protein